MKGVLAAAGDPGGARAVAPVLDAAARAGVSAKAVDHGFLAAASAGTPSWGRLPEASARGALEAGEIGVYLFGTSGRDAFALSLARHARSLGLPAVCVLDNWMNYRARLETDGLPLFVPDVYAVMDQHSYEGAVEEGVPPRCLRVTGHPALGSLASEWAHWNSSRREAGRPFEESGTPARLLFVSEPAEADQGGDESSPGFRGYTEKSVLRLLCRKLQRYASRVTLDLLPHPREDREALLALWAEVRGELTGGLCSAPSPREAVFLADAVCGMASILLYEAWLVGKPLLSLQPNLRLQHLSLSGGRTGCRLLVEDDPPEERFEGWLEEVRFPCAGSPEREEELARHSAAAQNVLRLILDFLE